MAQIVKLEPGDILVLTHMGSEVYEDLHANEAVGKFLTALKEDLRLRAILCFEGDVRISKAVLRGSLSRQEADEVWNLFLEAVPGDGGE